MRALAVVLVLLAVLAVGCSSDGKKGEFKDRDKPRRGATSAVSRP
jgi:hypothetical protein